MHRISLLSLLTTAAALAVEKRQSGSIDPSTTPLCTYYTDWPSEFFDQGETCASISAFWGISEQNFISWNPVVGSDCSSLIEGNSYCIEANGRPTTTSTTPTGPTKPSPTQGGLTADCQRFYLVENGDFCQKIVDQFGTFSISQFYSWNPAVGSSCGGLQAGYYVCVGVTGTPTSPPTSSSTTAAPTTTNDPSKPQPTQGGLTPDCQSFYLVQSGDFCQGIVDQYGTFSLSQFYSWNPAIGNSCGGLQAGYYVCVGVAGTPTTRPSSTTAAPTPTPTGPQPQQPGIINTCQRYYLVQQGDFCQAIVDQYGTFSLSQFYSWNPAVGNNCGGLQAGYYVCVGVPGTPTTRPTSSSATPTPTPTGPQPQQPGIITTCQRYYLVQPGDFCQAIVDRYGAFSLQQFYTWNPAVGNNCGGLQSGYYVCVGVAGTPTSPTSTSTTSTRPTGNPTPTPIQPGTPSNCSRYGQANPGGTCAAFAQRFGISLANLYRWNPVLGSNGQNCQGSFWAGYYYCVGV
ncbi:carbohydrate-binding module family 50 protein [Cercospora zeae-maydis SCOH1-5]|uniref:Carbohydrate-binding module family 50 protein n=1 Tax=Cercospora zeae-maydis SCOH1-5 TaxID=717836 RepID=A0A6A6F524_9PEZI|nr:carbohydrate-binding module family 50 protein [Cercospora zeae-maydis SCOH1-5]